MLLFLSIEHGVFILFVFFIFFVLLKIKWFCVFWKTTTACFDFIIELQ